MLKHVTFFSLFLIAVTWSKASATTIPDNVPCPKTSTAFAAIFNGPGCLDYSRSLCRYPGVIPKEDKNEFKLVASRFDNNSSTVVLGTIRYNLTTEDNSTYHAWFFGFPPNGTECINLKDASLPIPPEINYRVAGITMLFSEFESSKLFLMENPNFQGEFHWIEADKGSISANSIRSYIHVSNDHFVAYTERNYAGEKICFCASTKDQDGKNIQLPHDSVVRMSGVDMKIASAKRDVDDVCECLKNEDDGGDEDNGGGDDEGKDDDTGSSSRFVLNYKLFTSAIFFYSLLSFW